MMRRALVPLAIGCGFVAIVTIVLLVIGWDWMWFAIANGVVTVLLLVLLRGSVSGEDERRPPGRARVSAARWAGPTDPERLAARERRYEPDPGAVVDERMALFAEMNWMLPVAAAPAVAALVSLIWFV